MKDQERENTTPEQSRKDTAIRKLDYKDTNNILQEDEFELTPHVLEESKTYDAYSCQEGNSDIKESQKIASNFMRMTNHLKKSFEKTQRSVSRENKVSRIRQKDTYNDTPKVTIPVGSKDTPSSYDRGSNSSYSGDNDRDSLSYSDIITDRATLDFLNYYFEDSKNQVVLSKQIDINL